MKLLGRRLRWLSTVMLYALLMSPLCAFGSILTFDSCGTSSGAILHSCYGGSINPLYGNRVLSSHTDIGLMGERFYSTSGEGFTPNILTTIDGAFGWGQGYGGLENIIAADGYTGVIRITFYPDQGYKARIISFSMGAMMPPAEGYNGISVSVFDEHEGMLWTQSYSAFGSIDIEQLINQEGSAGSPISLVFDLRSLSFDPLLGIFDRELIGFDNVAFSQVLVEPNLDFVSSDDVPEISTDAMSTLGLVFIAIILYRRRNGELM